ncbi:hypothetical protein TruAng_005474 [Truncatella angustata]|nr:hypothetical protein TruAng_005474 [Truncatella angustata]
MIMIVYKALLVLVAGVTNAQVQSTISSSLSPTTTAAAPAFTYDRENFLLHGEPYKIIGGQIDPQRIPYQYWRDRLSKVRAMGVNTIFSYVFWNNLEPTQGSWLSDDPQNDIASYFSIAQEEGLNVVLRPGPYICGEHEWGGFPAWLSEIPEMVVRTNNTPFLEETKKYIVNLAERSGLAELQASRGGPILMVQVENEYGSFDENHNYTAALRDILRESFEVPLYTNDGGVDWTLEGGEIPGVLAEVDGGSWALPARDLYITNPTELGPLLDGDQWGSFNPHNTTVDNNETVSGFNGAMWQNRTTVFTSSYDYGSPIDETGRTTDLYFKMREAILPFVPNGSVPEPPENLPRTSIPEFELCSSTSLFDIRGEKVSSAFPLTMEALGQSYGFTLYEHIVTSSIEGFVQAGDRPRDRLLVYVNEKVIGVMDSQYQHPLNVSVSLEPGDKLQLLVENLGRVDYYSRGNPYRNYVQDPWKGVKGNVSIGDQVTLAGWDMYSLQLDSLPSFGCSGSEYPVEPVSDSPVFYYGSFVGPSISHNSTMTLDTFITVPHGIKGNVWVNGFHLGRYWLVGPQQSLYLPGSVIKSEEQNEVVVLELEPWQMNSISMVAYGASERFWGNSPDPDCLVCV